MALEEGPDLYTGELKLTDYPGKTKSLENLRPLRSPRTPREGIWTSDAHRAGGLGLSGNRGLR